MSHRRNCQATASRPQGPVDHHRLGLLRVQSPVQLFRATWPQHPNCSVGADPSAQLDLTGGERSARDVTCQEDQSHPVSDVSVSSREPTYVHPQADGVRDHAPPPGTNIMQISGERFMFVMPEL